MTEQPSAPGAHDSAETVERFVAAAQPEEVAHSLAEHMVTCTRHADTEAAQRWAGRCGELEQAGAGLSTPRPPTR
ncbi:hypothetical protein G5V58_03940 [Nocardioides anomalus]|uniref:Uncharacterized protein n=1 Tax=Nocardioides anomalus TaxID=2712223 RepID=A0A6G6W9X5_9ACTN|nr:hypothetical protein [Nocardioides anomalus]QIG42034.1 hypothetical protein G5V58_03940 [Nocardioides anomalus]